MSLQWKRRKMLAMRAKKTEEKKELSLDYKSKICEAAYFGKKGYTIPKSVLDANDLNSLYNELSTVFFIHPSLIFVFLFIEKTKIKYIFRDFME